MAKAKLIKKTEQQTAQPKPAARPVSAAATAQAWVKEHRAQQPSAAATRQAFADLFKQ